MTVNWLEGLGWSGVITVAISYFWGIFFPHLNLLAIAVVYVTTFIGWLFLTRGGN